MTTTYNVGFNPQFQFLDPSGKPAVGYVWETWRDVARDEPKACYQDPYGLFPYPLEIKLNGAGQVSPNAIFFADDENYYITVTPPGASEPLYVFPSFNAPAGGGIGPGPEELPYKNLFVNGQFTFAYNQAPLTFVATPFIVNLGPGWFFTKGNNNTATDTIRFPRFQLGQTSVEEGNPIQYFSYDCPGAGTGETVKKLYQTFSGVNSLENQLIAFQLQGMSTNNTIISITFTQNFGTGGAPSAPVTTNFVSGSMELTNTWDKFLASLTVPSTGGKTLGTNGDDYVAIEVNIPLNQATNVNLTNLQVVLGTLQPTYDYNTYDVENANSQTAQYAVPAQNSIVNLSTGISDVNRSITYGENNQYQYSDILPVGGKVAIAWDTTVITESNPLFPAGFLIANGRSVDSYKDNFKFRRLGAYMGNLYGYGDDGIAPYDNNGSGTIQFANVAGGTITNWADGNSGITITTPISGSGTPRFYATNVPNSTTGTLIYIQSLSFGGSGIPTVTNFAGSANIVLPGTSTIYQVVFATFPAATGVNPGGYLTVFPPSGQPVVYWYRKSGVGTQPSVPSAIFVQVDILNGDTDIQVARKTYQAINCSQITQLVVPAAGLITAGSYFAANGSSNSWAPYFIKDGVGVDPEIVGKVSVPIPITSTWTAAQVATQISTQLSLVQYNIPNWNNGLFARGVTLDTSETFDPDNNADARTNFRKPGSIQKTQNLSHAHLLQSSNPQILAVTTAGGSGLNAGSTRAYNNVSSDTTASGGAQSNPYNMYETYLIKF